MIKFYQNYYMVTEKRPSSPSAMSSCLWSSVTAVFSTLKRHKTINIQVFINSTNDFTLISQSCVDE